MSPKKGNGAAMYVQYGCGRCAPSDWLNFDASPTLRFERLPFIGKLYTRNGQRFPENVRYGDITKGLPIEPESCEGIYCSHVLEHLSLEDADKALSNTQRYLQEGGIFRLVVPDLRHLAIKYLERYDESAAHEFMDESVLGRRVRQRGISALLFNWLGNSAHLWMWDEVSMRGRLEQHGFTAIRRCAFADCEDPRFKEVEDEARFNGCLAMECRK